MLRTAAGVRDLHACNVAILVGANMREPVHAMVCWTENGRAEGGVGIAIRLAKHYRVPILNLAEMDMHAAMDRLERIRRRGIPGSWSRNSRSRSDLRARAHP